MRDELVVDLIEKTAPFTCLYTGPDANCHRGICSAEECVRCGKVIKLRSAVEAVKAELRMTLFQRLGRTLRELFDFGT